MNAHAMWHRALAGPLIVVLMAHALSCRTQVKESPTMSGADRTWVAFQDFYYRGADDAPAPREGEFLNPILAGCYPDPSICRAGDDFYLICSSFAYFPGVPIFRSRDLVNWTQIGHVLDRPSQLNVDGAGVSEGIFAPAISFHDGVFYMVTTIVHGGGERSGNFFVTARDPAGPWSEPYWLPDVDGIDPSLFFDDDGQAYLVHNGPPPENKSLYDGHRAVWIHRFDPIGPDHTPGEAKIIVNGGVDLSKKPIWIEAPHIFKRNGKYYLIAAEGGTADAHSEVVFRSDHVWGPYVPATSNPILTQRKLPATRPSPITCVGHADFVTTPAGEWWAVYLGCRPYDQHPTGTNIGRETFLSPVRWEDNWPRITRADEVLQRTATRPKLAPQAKATTPHNGAFEIIEMFHGDDLGMSWVFLRTPRERWHAIDRGVLRLAPRDVPLSARGNPSFIARRQQHAIFQSSVTITPEPTTADCDAGIVAFQNETRYLFLGVRIRNGAAAEVFVEQFAAPRDGKSGEATIIAQAKISAPATRVELRIRGAGQPYGFDYRVNDSQPWTPLIDNVDGSILSTRSAGGFVGTFLGVFARVTKLP